MPNLQKEFKCNVGYIEGTVKTIYRSVNIWINTVILNMQEND